MSDEIFTDLTEGEDNLINEDELDEVTGGGSENSNDNCTN